MNDHAHAMNEPRTIQALIPIFGTVLAFVSMMVVASASTVAVTMSMVS